MIRDMTGNATGYSQAETGFLTTLTLGAMQNASPCMTTREFLQFVALTCAPNYGWLPRRLCRALRILEDNYFHATTGLSD